MPKRLAACAPTPRGGRSEDYVKCAEILLALDVPVQQGFIDMASDEVAALIEPRL